MEFLNEYSGLFSLLAVVASVVAIVVCKEGQFQRHAQDATATSSRL